MSIGVSGTPAGRPTTARYGFAVAVSLLATSVRLLLDPLLGTRLGFLTFFPAVMLSGWFGGLSAGIVSTILSTLIADYFWFEPVRSFTLANPGDVIAIAVFVATGIGISALNDGLHRARAREESLRRAAEEAERQAEAANHAKDLFLARVSHELRTPLNALVGWTRMLRDGSVAAARVPAAIASIDRNADILTKLVEDLVEMSRITTGQLRLEREHLDIVTVVEESVSLLEPAATAKRIRVEMDVEPDRPKVDGDSTRLRQVFWNLLSNAVKFTPSDGTVVIRVRLNDGEVKIAVSDTGQGIASEFVPHVFEPFMQAASSGPGLGLGLAIVQQLVKAHGGRVSVTSAGVGAGATFTIYLPVLGMPAAV